MTDLQPPAKVFDADGSLASGPAVRATEARTAFCRWSTCSTSIEQAANR